LERPRRKRDNYAHSPFPLGQIFSADAPCSGQSSTCGECEIQEVLDRTQCILVAESWGHFTTSLQYLQ
jgi:hypothetical protein